MTFLKEGVKAVLPDAMVRRIQAKLSMRAAERQQPSQPIDLSRIGLIHNAPFEQLSDPTYLENDLLPRLGLNGEEPETFPRSLHPYLGFGLLHWQYPNQFAKYLVELSRHGIESYLELGVRHGGTFVITVEYLSRFKPVRRALGVDLVAVPELKRYASTRPGVTVRRADSHSDAFRRLVEAEGPFDLALIDGDHSERGCRRDFETVRDNARNIAFHDVDSPSTAPGVVKVWQQAKRDHADRFDFLEFTDQYEEVEREHGVRYLGLGLAIARDPI
jgi:Methyltransferase domain